jgi:CubicO group peptidase (beta-lactamase class C family)
VALRIVGVDAHGGIAPSLDRGEAGRGAFGTSWYVDPKEGLVGVFMTQRRPDRLAIVDFILDFWTSAYQLIDD